MLALGHCLEHSPNPEPAALLNLYLGNNTPERKDYIKDRLVVPVEEQLLHRTAFGLDSPRRIWWNAFQSN